MKTYIKPCSLLLLLVWASITLSAQDAKRMSLTFMNESIAFPFTSYKQFHPGLEFGMSLRTIEKEHSLRTINAYVGWFYHQNLENSFFLRSDYQYDFNLTPKLKAGLYGGLGYMHTFYPGELYEMDQQTGEFSETKQFGRPRAIISSGLSVGWYSEEGIGIFLKQEFTVETPFANGIPVMPHSFLKLGISKAIKS